MPSTLKALRKEPGRRYGSADLLAQDIQRFLSQQPVEARVGNRRYRFGRFIRRNRIESCGDGLPCSWRC